ncbi:MAG: hypothetical protein IPL08_21105 [Saprospiraceae bacterium]|nr:hypothetical protein [Saprospiraceae bacterium]
MKTKLYTSWITILLYVMVFIPSLSASSKTTSTAWPFTLNCPANVYVSCTDELWNLSMYGNATYTYGYYTYSAGSPTVSYHLNSCNAGYITRTWMVEDYNWQWHTCTQTIYVSAGGAGGPQIDWPEDIELEGCNPNTNPNNLPAPYNYPTWSANECSMLGKSYSDMTFTVNNQCKKIMRTWKVLDWCNYTPSNGYGIYTKVQIIYIINNTPPEITCPAEITVNSFNCKNANLVVNPLTLSPAICGGEYEVFNNSPYSNSKGNNISGTYPIGTTKVIYTVKYACGKTKTCATNVVVLNASKPTPYCLGKIITALMPLDTNNDGVVDNGMVQLWAKDLNKGSVSSCGNNPLKFSFSKDVTETSKTFTCDHIGKNMVQMWVTDSKGAQNYCIVEVTIQNNGANIPDCHPKPVAPVDPVYSQKGIVLSLTDTPVKGAEITIKQKNPSVIYHITYDTTEILQLDSFINLSGYKLYRYITVKKITEHKDSTVAVYSRSIKTDSLGKYLVDSIMHHNKAMVVSGKYNDDARRFIDNKDVELLTKFLLGEVTFTSYHQYLASDINEDNKINVDDQNLLMAFVTGQTTTLPGDHQWYLLDKKAVYTKPEDVFKTPLPLTVTLDSIKITNTAVDFIAIKKGNISIDAGSLQQFVVESRAMITESENVVKAYPNPFTDQLTFNIRSEFNQTGLLQIFNSNGTELIAQKYDLNKGLNEINVTQLNDIQGLIIYRWTLGEKQYSGTLSCIR